MEPHAGPRHGRHGHDFDWAAMVGHAEAEAEALAPVLTSATSALAELSVRGGLDVRRILDIGSGPGVGTCALAQRFPAAAVVAADGSTEMLANVAARAERLGLSDRVTTRLVDLPDGLDDLDQADVVWASMVLHHVGDEAATLRSVRSRLPPGGLLALVEFGGPARFVPDGPSLGSSGFWDRLDAARTAWLADMRAGLPGATASADYPTMLRGTGFEVVTDGELELDLPSPLDDQARQFALGHLKSLRERVEPYAEPADLAVVDVLVDEGSPAGILRRPDAFVHASRRLFLARAAAIPQEK